jgi:predicted ATPase
VLLVLEDLHWSDDTSLEFLHYLARRCAAHRLLLLLTYRSDEVRPGLHHFLAQLDRERLVKEILLARLTRDEVEAMLRAIFALPPSARLELPDPIYALTEGNPFFVEEALKSLIAVGEIFYANGRWDRKPLGELHVPRSAIIHRQAAIFSRHLRWHAAWMICSPWLTASIAWATGM